MDTSLIDKQQIWAKNWTGNWSFLFATLYGGIYTKGLKGIIGKGIENFIITFENGTSSNYLVPKEIEKLCGLFIKHFREDETLGEKWANHVIEKSEEITNFIGSLEENLLTVEDYRKLCFLCSSMTPENFAIKKTIDYMTEDLLHKYIDLFSKARKATEPIYNEVDRILQSFLKQCFQGRFSSSEYNVISKEEFEVYLSTNELPNLGKLSDRYNGCACIFNGNGESSAVMINNDYKKLMDAVLMLSHKDLLKGTPAYKGVIQGKVRIILDPKNPGKFKKGDILVTGMTRPEYLPLMKQSAAFITDAGGLLSHAAIVARELKKPCIVGTEIATKVLKDGDLVEVDAEKGIVRIL